MPPREIPASSLELEAAGVVCTFASRGSAAAARSNAARAGACRQSVALCGADQILGPGVGRRAGRFDHGERRARIRLEKGERRGEVPRVRRAGPPVPEAGDDRHETIDVAGTCEQRRQRGGDARVGCGSASRFEHRTRAGDVALPDQQPCERDTDGDRAGLTVDQVPELLDGQGRLAGAGGGALEQSERRFVG
jgi:hypothetical protein